MRVLFYNHTAVVSGAERSMLDLAEVLPAGVEPVVACPAGDLATRARALGLQTVEVPGTSGSFRLHPVRTSRALTEMTYAAWSLARVAKRLRCTVVDANSIRAGLIGVEARTFGAPPPVVRIRDVLPEGRPGSFVASMLRRGSGGLIANSSHTAARFPGSGGAALQVVYPPLDLYRGEGHTDRTAMRRSLGIPDAAPVLIQVAQITQWKGQAESIEMLGRVRQRHPDARLVLVGEAKFVDAATRYDNRSYLAGLHASASVLGDDAVLFLGERDDVPSLLAAADVALSPSWEEPFGRSVVEAMNAGLPVVATDRGGPTEVITDRIDGFLLAPRAPAVWADLIVELLRDQSRRSLVGQRARDTALRFDRRHQADQLEAVYAAFGLA